jgi:transcriptional regulator with XRE-family HTH domain
MTRNELAASIGISPGHLSDILNKKSEIGLRSARAIGEYLGIHFHDVYRIEIRDLERRLFDKMAEATSDNN